ncbi:hypothetical protein [Prescottella subtropica]|uniref:hypothetical protein n=1 Tax=Prescottella subtropica TaxID=2545757 RepID=UPI0010F45547|nr:hypothetical protein [Prescottella subtropica]
MSNTPRITPISREDAAAANPNLPCGPLVVDDGHVHAVGESHGRLLPMVGQLRPFLYDVAFDGKRVYADRVEDVLAMMLGERYAELVAAVDVLDANPVPAPDDDDIEPFDDVVAAADETGADNIDVAATDADLAAFAAHMHYSDEIARNQYEMALIRRQHADGIRVRLQAGINDTARTDGTWQILTDEQQQLLVSAGDDNGMSPAGVIEEVPVLVDGVDGTLTQTTVERGVWTADTRLVVNTGDYAPWEPIPFPESALIRLNEHDEEVEVPTRSNLVVLRIDTPDDYIESLSEAGIVRLSVTPAEQPDDFFREAEAILVQAAVDARSSEGSAAQPDK